MHLYSKSNNNECNRVCCSISQALTFNWHCVLALSVASDLVRDRRWHPGCSLTCMSDKVRVSIEEAGALTLREKDTEESLLQRGGVRKKRRWEIQQKCQTGFQLAKKCFRSFHCCLSETSICSEGGPFAPALPPPHCSHLRLQHLDAASPEI